jgi:hypothetical protein
MTARPRAIKPTRKLGSAGQNLWASVTAEYAIADSGGVEMLVQACQALDRAEKCRALIDRDGEVIANAKGLRDHPLLKSELANRSFVVRTLQRLGLDVEPVRPVGRPAGTFGRG